MFPNLDPKKMQQVMKQMGISQEEIEASRVIIETFDKKIIIENPSVTKIKMHGQESFQITGEIHEETNSNALKDDIKTIMEKTGCSEKKAKETLKKTGDLAETILELKS